MDVIEGLPIAKGVLTPTVVTSLPAVDIERANAVLITVESNPARMSVVGTDVSATTDHVLAAGSTTFLKGEQMLRDIQFIDTASGASKVRYTTLATD